MPNTAPSRKNRIVFAFDVAASAASPRPWPTQIAFTDPLSDCSTLPARIGSENKNNVLPIGPSVSERLGRCIVADMSDIPEFDTAIFSQRCEDCQ